MIDFRQIKADIAYLITNIVINHIPSWCVRKVLYQALGMKIGKNCRIGIGTIVIYPSKIELADRAIVNEYCFLDGRGGLKIGNNTSISIYTKLISASHKLNNDNFEYQFHPIIINDYAFIGAGAIILEGTEIGRGCAIGAGAVCKGNYDSDSIYFGNPANRVGVRKSDYSYELFQNYYFR